jgi:hypothetical protein
VHPAEDFIDGHDPHYHQIQWGRVSETSANTFLPTELEFDVNGSGTWVDDYTLLVGGAVAWYEIDLTDRVRNAVTWRPATGGAAVSYLFINARAKTGTGVKTCFLDAQVQVRTSIRQVSTF